ncbi:RNA polymerase sigma factor [Stieleria marina]|uniref:ECF RNA polymerase sigma factor SigG n=1 Tax=Stieleria marina TaxID=1930275 RepID=A0A517NS62_9BACT|nr:ECF RNA polymerase sigma factor SigG [Planctomycetes bacterium K23_9]
MDDLFIANQPPIYRFLLRLSGSVETASDLSQETLARGWQKREQLRDSAALRTWLLRIAHNTFCEYARQQKQHGERGWEPLEASTLACREASPGKLSSDQELGEQIWHAMGELPPRQSQVLHLRVVEQLKTHEIADVLGINAQAVRSNLSAARKNMRERLGDSVSKPSNPKAIG